MKRQLKLLSPGAHKALELYDWTTTDGITYTSERQPGESVILMGHSDAGGGRKTLAWKHDRPDNASFVATGVDFLEYHLMRAHPDYPNFGRKS